MISVELGLQYMIGLMVLDLYLCLLFFCLFLSHFVFILDCLAESEPYHMSWHCMAVL